MRSFVPQCVLKAVCSSDSVLLQTVALCEQLEGLVLRGYPVRLLRSCFLAVCERRITSVPRILRKIGCDVLKGLG